MLTTVWSFIQSRIERRLAVSDRSDDEISFRERMFGEGTILRGRS
jgi:hypothetical protein